MPLFPEDMLETSGDNLPDMPKLPDVYTGVYQKPQIKSYFQPGGPGPGATEKSLSYDDLVKGMSSSPYGLSAPQSQVTPQQLFSDPRYGHYDENTNWEDIYGQNQSGWQQAINGTLKGLNLAATTVAGGFGMIYGLAKSPFSGRLADIWDNKVMRDLDDWNKKVDNELLPNYYTNAEKNAAWYSTDNWFTTNFLFDKLVKNSGYAVGAMISGNIANAGLMAAGTRIASGAARAAVAAEASQAFKVFTPLLKNTARAFSAGKNIEAAAILEKEVSSIADLTSKTSRLAEINAQTAKFAGLNNNFRRTVIAAYSSAGEASFEALQTASEFRDNLIAQYRKEHGEDPTGEALDRINKDSEKVGKTSFFGNMALLGITEFVQLPYLAGSSYRNTKAAANGLISRTDDVLLRDGKYVASQPTSRFGKLYEKVTGIGRYIFDPKEAAQEVGQYALQVGTQNYFNKARQGKDADAFVDGFLYGFVGKDERGEGKGAFVSKEGMESLLLGGITGGLMQAFGPGGRPAQERAIKSNTQKFIGILNDAPTFQQAFKDRLDGANRGIVLNQQYEDAVISGDELEARDLHKDILHNYLAPRIKYGRFDMVMSDLADLKMQGSTEEGLASLKEQGMANMNDTVQQYQERISGIETVANYTNTLYESLDLRYSGMIDKEGNKIYPTHVIDKMAYAASKVADYDVRIPDVNNNLAEAGIDTAKVLEDVIKDNKPKEESISEAVAQIDRLDVNSDIKEDLKKDLRDVVELSLRRKMFLEEYDDIKANPQKYNDQIIDEELDIPEEGREVIKIKTKTGEQNIEIGTEYFLGRVVEYDKNGKEVYRFPKLTVIGKNEDGTIKIKDSNGNIKDVSKDVLLDYKLGKVSDTLNNKKAKFFMDNANTVFEFNFGKKTIVKDGKKTTVSNKVRGRLEYSSKDGTLNFVFKNKSGNIQRIEVTGDQFVAKQGYDQAMIIPVGTLTAVQKKSLEDYAAEKDVRMESKRRSRLNILKNLFDEVATKLDETTSLITKKREELAKVNDELAKVEEQIKSGDLTKKNTFKSATNKAIKAANKLSRLREDLRLEIEALEAQKEELEFNLAYVSDMAQNIDELPTDSKEFLEELKEQVSYLEDMTLETGKNINSLSKLMNSVEKALQSAIDYAFNLINRFEKKYPDMPIAPEGLRQFLNKDLEFKGVWPEYQSYLQANPNLMRDLMEFDRELAEIDELDVIPNERTLGELRQEMEGLQNTLSEISQELAAKQLILSRFQEAADRYKTELAEEQKIKDNMALQDQILGTLTSDQQTLEADEKYEADRKKADRVVVSATVSSGGERSNRFGFNFGKFENKEHIRGVYVTENNEKELGLDGFTQRIVDEADPTAPPVEKSKIIALVMVQENPEDSENFWLVDENGKPISDSVDALDEVIYQVMPLEDLEWDDKWSKTPGKKISMFRKSTPEEVVKALKEQYKEWRKNTIENPSIARHAVEPSFGIPQYVTEKNELGESVRVKDAAVAVEDSGLISEDDLRTRRVVMVPTVEKSIEKGSTLFNDPKGLPFLETETGYVKLQNRPLTKQEVNTVYQAIKRLVDIIYQEGDAQSVEAKRLYNWLKSVVYWGTPKDAPGYNSIWFQRVADEDGVFAEFRLFLSGKGESIPFTPSAIRENESMLKTILSGMYNNVNATMVRGGQKIDWNEPYEEILSISESGEVSSRTWDNYQSFLLSKVDPDGKQRDAKEIPLTTQIKPLTVPGEVNREGIYFMVPEVAQSYTIPEIKAKKASVITPGAPKKGAPVSGKEAKKADIERRRQEELNKRVPKQELLYRDDEGREYVITYTNDGKLKLSIPVENGTQNIGEYDANVPIENIIAGAELVGEYERKNKQSFISKINAKYDAELATLEGAKPTEAKLSASTAQEFSSKTDPFYKEATALTNNIAKALNEENAEQKIQSLINQFNQSLATYQGWKLKASLSMPIADLLKLKPENRASGTDVSFSLVPATNESYSVEKGGNEIQSLGEMTSLLDAASFDKASKAFIKEYNRVVNNIKNDGTVGVPSIDFIDNLFALKGAKPAAPAAPVEAKFTASTLEQAALRMTPFFDSIETLATDVNEAFLKNDNFSDRRKAITKVIDDYNASLPPYQGWKLEVQLSPLTDLKKIEKAFKDIWLNFNLVPADKTDESIETFTLFKDVSSNAELMNILTARLNGSKVPLEEFEAFAKNIIDKYNRIKKTYEREGKIAPPNIDFIDNLLTLKGATPAASTKAEPSKYDLTGKKQNTFVSDSGMKILFTANGTKILLEGYQKGITVLRGEDLDASIQKLKGLGKTLEEAQNIIKSNIFKAIYEDLKIFQEEEEEFVVSGDDEDVADVEFSAEDTAGEDISDEDMSLFDKQSKSSPDRTALRLRLKEEIEKFEGEDWNKVISWLKANFPNVPVYRVKNILQSTNGLQAWGMLQDGAIYIYENAEVGTIYHEVFEAVWKMFTDPKEQRAVLKEFKNRKGSFEERTTGNMVKYSEATAQQAKEQLAEEFRDYVKDGKVPPKPTNGRPFIVKIFADLVNFIKTFFTGKSAKNNTEKLFEKIGTGYYKAHSPYHAKLAFAKEGLIDIEDAIVSEDAEFRLKNIRGENIGDIIQHMTFLTIKKLISTNQSLFNVPNLNKTELYEMLKEEVTTAIAQKAGAAKESLAVGEISKEQANRKIAESLALWKSVSSQWDEIISKHEEQLRSYNIEFDENDGVQLRDEDASKKSDWQDATKIDNFKKANGAIKLLLSTIPITRRLSDGTLETIPSSINGVKLLPATEVYMAILNRASNARNIDEMMEIIRQMAIEDANYAALYSRLTKNLDVTKKANLTTSLKDIHDVRLLTAFWKSFKKQNPDVKNVYILDNGDVVVGDSNFTTATNQLRDEYVNSIREVMKNKNPYFEYNAEKRRYVGKRGALASYEGTTEKRVAFLKSLGIEFTVNEINLSLSFSDRKKFGTAVDGIADSIKNAEEIATIGGGNLKIAGRLREIAEIQAKLDNPEFNSTYFNVNGERVQTFIGTNAASDLYNELNSISNLSQLEGTQYEYLTKDTFAKNSVLLKKMFDLKTGKKIEGAENYLKTAYADGIVNAQTGRNKESSKLSFRDRMVQEINLNLNGYYLNLVPGDASLEWMIYMGNMISEKSITSGLGDTLNVFRGYLIDEINLARDKSRTVAKDRNKNELRFMKDILGEDLQNKIMKDKRSAEDIVKDPAIKSAVDKAVTKFINDETSKFRQTLEDYRVIEKAIDDEGNLLDGYDLNNIGTDETSNVSNEKVNLLLKRLTINYMINNIELHKLLYSDPYQYSDELKRIKNFLSPRQAIMYGSADFNTVMNKTYNEGYEKKDIGRVNFDRDFFKTATLKDIQAIGKLPGYTPWDEADGGGMIVFQANRNFRIRSGEWNDREELQYRYDIAYEKVQKGIKLSPKENKIWEAGNPGVMSAYTTLKPIVAGNKADGNSYNDIILDKFALYVLSYRVLHQMDPNSNALKMYEKMRKEELDYVVFNTARKVGARESYDVYNKEGKFIDDVVYEEVTNVPFSIMSVQQEVPSKEDHQVTRGSQMTKLITMDYMEAGVPVDFMEGEKSFNKRMKAWYALGSDEAKREASPIYEEVRNNQDLLEEMINVGYQRLLKQFNITEIKKGEFEIKPEDMPKVVAVLREEMLKREVNDNISEALTGFESGDVVLEATPAYQQVRNILYSIADREVISPKINGGQKVQIPSSLLESERAQMTEINGKKGYTSDYLQFYEDADGKRVCEIMVARWFDSNKTDEELLDYFNNTEEGQKQLAALTGVAFRIPTQKQNSIDSFVIKKFLPKEFGDNVVIPSELVKKMGSDFDIDKLYIYLKNMYVDGKGNVKMVPFYGIGLTEDVRDKFEDLFEEIANAKIEKVELGIEKATKMQRILSDVLTDKMPAERKEKWINILKQIYGEDASAIDIEDAIMTRLQKLGKQKEDLYNLEVQEVLMNDFVETMYKKSLENAYIQSSQNLVSHPKNFKRLVAPNSAQQMKDLSAKIVDKLGVTKFDYKAPVNMLSREFMNRLRHAFVSGKYAIGIAAVNQTNHSLNQRSPIIIDPSRLEDVNEQDQKWLKDASIRFKKYNKIDIGGEPFATLSMIENAEGQDISDIIGQFIDGYVDISKGPWIIEFGASPNVAGTWLILIKAGVPIEDVAYFMNQPIVKDLLREVESAGSTWLFNEDLVESLKASPEYAVAQSQVDKVDVIPNKTSLFEMIGNKKLTPEQRAQQHFILDEFLKYSKMSSHLLKVTQGTNFDTAAFNDPFLVFKKMVQLDAAEKSIISSAGKILSNSFIGDLAARINDIRNAFASILKSDSGTMRQVVQTILYPHVNLPDRDFIKLSQKVVADVFDWAVQNDREINQLIEETLLSNTKSAAKEMNTFVKSVKKDRTHPLYNNQVIKLFNPKFNEKQNGVNNIQIKNKDNKVYDQNQIIFAFDEIKNYLKGQGKMDLYNKLVRASVLQSGLSNSPIAFTSLLPYEDFKEMYNKTLSKLEKNGKFALKDFVKFNVFERNNWNNDDVVPRRKAQWRKDAKGKFRYNTNMYFGRTNRNIERDIKAGKIPNLLKLSTLAREGNYDIIVYSWEVGTKAQKEAMRKASDFSYIKKGLFKKVYDVFGDPLLEKYTVDGKERFSFVYKAINAWGDGSRANEFYDDGRKSVIDNGFIKVNEVADQAIIPYFTPSMETEEGAPQEEAPTELPEIDVPNTRFVSRTSMKLKDGVTYRLTAIDSQRLEKMGYTPQEIGKILKAIC